MIRDFLYNNPDLFEKVFPRGRGDLCVSVFQKYLSQPPFSILDIGCGTGRDLSQLSKRYPDCVGFDILPSMVAFAQKNNPDLTILTGDMRTCRLHRTFDAICALGGSINFALSNEELDETIKTYQAHAHEGTLLLVQPLNPCLFFGEFQAPDTFSVPYNGSKVIGTATYKVSKIQQIVERTRTWKIEGESNEFTDSVRFRIIFPAELAYFLNQHGFEVLEIFEKPGSAIYVKSMYLVGRFKGK